jgi:sigma-B regulation protein RsbU (phosphoserine phosphatase)
VPLSLQAQQVEDLLKLQKAAQKISSILDLDQLIEKIVTDVAISFGCVEANIYLHDEENAEMTLAGTRGCTLHCKGHRLKVGEQGMVGYVAGTRQMRYAPDVRKDEYYIACEESVLSEVAIPLLVQEKLIGVFTASHPELDAFPAQQVKLLHALCSHVAVAVQNARLFQFERQARERMSREADEARVIQQALLPKSSPFIPGFQVSGLSIPAGEVGGDWYDFIDLEDGRWGLVLADVAGKGTAAALLMSGTRGMLRSLAGTHCSPAEVLTKLNRMLGADFPSGRFVTMVYGVLDPEARTLTYASAGHLPPLLADDQGIRSLDTERGVPLGLGLGEFSETRVSLDPGARLVFYSDGITEAADGDGEEYGVARLKNYLSRPESCAEKLVEDVRLFASGTGLLDDATVIHVNA